jgi:hypothetical protein
LLATNVEPAICRRETVGADSLLQPNVRRSMTLEPEFATIALRDEPGSLFGNGMAGPFRPRQDSRLQALL